MALDPVTLTQDLIRFPSVTPKDAGALPHLRSVLDGLGFATHLLVFDDPGSPPITNLFARLGNEQPSLAFNGHTDVVPPGEGWSADPFAGVVQDGILIGRGAVDMKSGVAAFTAAVSMLIERGGPPRGSISLLITGDEEGAAINGSKKLLEWAEQQGHRFDACIVGEPTSREQLGDMVKIGRRGSLSGHLTVHGKQGHVAYPDRADNAAHRIARMVATLTAEPPDQGSEHFDPSSLQVSTIDIGNPAGNVVPATARATFNIRYCDRQDPASLEVWLRSKLDSVGGDYELRLDHRASVFLSEPGAFGRMVADSVEKVCARRPVFSTSGGSSDARFVRHYCPVVEVGLVGKTMHEIDEQVPVTAIRSLSEVYVEILQRFFALN